MASFLHEGEDQKLNDIILPWGHYAGRTDSTLMLQVDEEKCLTSRDACCGPERRDPGRIGAKGC